MVALPFDSYFGVTSKQQIKQIGRRIDVIECNKRKLLQTVNIEMNGQDVDFSTGCMQSWVEAPLQGTADITVHS